MSKRLDVFTVTDRGAIILHVPQGTAVTGEVRQREDGKVFADKVFAENGRYLGSSLSVSHEDPALKPKK